MDVNSPEAELWSENMRLKSENEYLQSRAEIDGLRHQFEEEISKLCRENERLRALLQNVGKGESISDTL